MWIFVPLWRYKSQKVNQILGNNENFNGFQKAEYKQSSDYNITIKWEFNNHQKIKCHNHQKYTSKIYLKQFELKRECRLRKKIM